MHTISRVVFLFCGVACALAPAALAPSARAQTFDRLDPLAPGFALFGTDVSADGNVAFGYGAIGFSTQRAAKWLGSSTTAVTTLSPVTAYQSCISTAINADGSVGVGTSIESPASFAPTRATRWVGSAVQNLGILPNGHGSYAHGVSGDGSVVVGYCLMQDGSQIAYRWSSTGGMVPIGTFNGGNITSAQDVSQDGSVIVGALPSVARAYRWTLEDGVEDLGNLTPGGNSVANGVSSDGAVIVGRATVPGGQQHAMRWTSALGMQSIGTLPNGTTATASDTNADGSVIVGQAFVTGAGNRAFVWTPGTGMLDLREYLAQRITGLDGWILSAAGGVSDDGATIVGWGTLNGVVMGFRVSGLSFANPCPACAADFDANGGIDGGDLAAFFAEFEVGGACADVDLNGGVDGGDLGAFFVFYEVGGC